MGGIVTSSRTPSLLGTESHLDAVLGPRHPCLPNSGWTHHPSWQGMGGDSGSCIESGRAGSQSPWPVVLALPLLPLGIMLTHRTLGLFKH